MQESIKKAITTCLEHGISFYAFREPGGTTFSFGAQVDSDFQANEGFRIVPFVENNDYKKSTIYKQFDATNLPDNMPILPKRTNTNAEFTKEEYLDAATECINRIRNNETLKKVVLSRTINIDATGIDRVQFLELLERTYPNAFVFIYQTPTTGSWIGATPETLGKYDGTIFRTVALAGTRKVCNEKWDEKDIEEQEFVVKYISNLADRLHLQYKISPKYTKNAGHIEHLCNDFYITERDYNKITDFVNLLHPTPALAGLPKDEAINSILDIEKHDRKYYGGYIGPFNGNCFYYSVNLRSLSFDDKTATLYIGGGITDKSNPEKEYSETIAKSQTLLSILSKIR